MNAARPTDSFRRFSTSDRSIRDAIPCTSEALERRVMLSNVVPVGTEFRVNAYTNHDQRRPSIAMDSQGDFVIAWASNEQDGSGSGIYAQRYDVAGVPQGDEFRVNTYTTDSQMRPSVAMDADGDFVIAWSGVGQGATGIFARRFDAGGAPQGDAFHVGPGLVGQAFGVAMDADGDFVVAWQGPGDSVDGIRARRYNAAGVPQGQHFRINTQAFQYHSSVAVAMDAQGDFVVTWDGIAIGIRARRFDAAGAPQGGEFVVNTHTINAHFNPSVDMNAAGNFVITWRAIQDGALNVYAQRYSADGAAQGGELLVSNGIGVQTRAAVAIEDDSDFVVAWQGYPQDQSSYGIYARRYDSAGVARGAEFQVNTFTPNTQEYPAIATNAGGDFVVAWESDAQDGSGEGVFAQRFAVVPEVTASSFLFESSPQRLRLRFNHDVRSSLGTDDLVVRNISTGQTIPANEFVLLYDPTGDVATFIYVGPGNGSIAGVLPDGRYRATLSAGGVTTPQGASPPADHVFDFFFLNGDADRDGHVGLGDFNILASHFGQSGTDFTRGDFTFDGTTDLDDFNLLAARFGTALPSAARPGGGAWSDPVGDKQEDEQDSLGDLLR